MRRIASFALFSSAVLLLGACQMDNRRSELLTPQRPQGVEGSWASLGGQVAYNANFSGGRFTSTEAGTGAILAQGTYQSLGPGQVTIEYTSTVRAGTKVAANCNQVDVNRLACASSSGNRFEFTRRL